MRVTNCLHKKNTARSRPGFTLVELMIVASVFSLTMLIGATVFTTVQTRQTETLRRQRLVADGRYVLETIARTARIEAIDYRYYYTDGVLGGNSLRGPAASATNAVPILVTRDDTNKQTCFKYDNVTRSIQVSTDCQTSPDWQTITPTDVRVTAFNVYIAPRSNPYAPAPRVASDCRSNTGTLGFSQAGGVCLCRWDHSNGADSAADNDCYPGQQCINPLQDKKINSQGEGLCENGDPSCHCRNAMTQPHVTIYMATDSLNAPVGANAKVSLQTTVVSRAYGR